MEIQKLGKGLSSIDFEIRMTVGYHVKMGNIPVRLMCDRGLRVSQ